MWGCSDRTDEAPPPRFAAVASKKGDATKKWCDLKYDDASAPRLELPALAYSPGDTASSQLPEDRWIWLNVWATWCGPCREEMPLLAHWSTKLGSGDHPLALWYLSVDEDPAEVVRFFKKNPTLVPGHSVRLRDLEALPEWLSNYGMNASTAIPIQILAAPGRKVRCIRMGSVSPSDLSRVKSLMKHG